MPPLTPALRPLALAPPLPGRRTVRRVLPARPDELPWVAAVPLPTGRGIRAFIDMRLRRGVFHMMDCRPGVGRRRAGGTATSFSGGIDDRCIRRT